MRTDETKQRNGQYFTNQSGEKVCGYNPNKIGFLPQNVKLNDNVSAIKMIEFFADLKNTDPKVYIKFAKELELDVTKTVRNFSPGQQRKLQLIIATIGSPTLLVLDEPTAGLDPVGVQQVREIIRTLRKKGCTIFISSHVLAELDNLCSKVAIIQKGQMLYQGLCSSAYEFETDGAVSDMIELLPEDQKEKCTVDGAKLIANIHRNEVPEFLESLYTRGIRVFGVRRQGLETLYNHFAKESV